MYIHGYQIHNVLNAYRKQLSQPGGNTKTDTVPPPGEPVNPSEGNPRQSVFDKISAEIVDRITQFDASTQFNAVVSEKFSLNAAPHKMEHEAKETDFSYNVIDEHNRKITNTLPLQRLNPVVQPPYSADDIVDTGSHQSEKE